MKPAFDQIIVGSWEVLNTTQPDIDISGLIYHFSSDGHYTMDTPSTDNFVHPGRYRIEEDKLISIWASWGKPDTVCKLALEENGDLKITDFRGFVSLNRRVSDFRPYTQAFIDSDGKLKRRKETEPCVPASRFLSSAFAKSKGQSPKPVSGGATPLQHQTFVVVSHGIVPAELTRSLLVLTSCRGSLNADVSQK